MKVKLFSADGNKIGALVGEDQALQVVEMAYPALEAAGQSSRLRYLSGYVGSTGLGSGTTNMNVNGSVTPQEFYIEAATDYDIRIMQMVIYIQDGSVTHSGMGALAALTNGIDIYALESGEQTYFIQGAKTFANLIEQTAVESPWGDSATAFELESVSGTEDAQILPFNVQEILPNGLRLGRGTRDRVVVKVNDNLTGLTSFTVRIMGYKHYPPIPPIGD